MKKEQIIKDIENYVGSDDNSRWYAGITNDIKRRLFGEHNVEEKKDRWIWRPADSKEDAQEVEEYFLDKGMEGDTGGGNDDTTFVYAFKMNGHTDPRG